MNYYACPAFSVFALLLLAGSAFGQFVQQVEITVKPKLTDQLIAFGSTKGLNATRFQTLTFTVGPHAFVLSSSQFKNTKGKLKYTGKGRFAGISSFEIDTKKKKFSLTTKNYPFSSLSNPLQISLATDATTKCETLQLKQRASKSKPKRAKVIRGSATHVMVKKRSLGGCSLAGDLQLSPPVIKEGTSTAVEVSMRFPIPPSPGSAKLFVRSSAGAPTGSALCTFADDGAEGSADRVAGDGMYGCKAALTPSKLGTLDLIVQATIGGKMSYSPSLPVTVVKPLTDAIAEATAATHEAASSVFGQMVAKYGDTEFARTEALRLLRTMKGIKSAEIAGATDKYIFLVFDSGVRSALLTSARRQIAAGHSQLSAVSKQALSGVLTQDSSKQVFIGEGPLIWPDDSAAFEDRFKASKDDGFTINRFTTLSVETLKTMTSYGTVMLAGHGFGYKGEVFFLFARDNAQKFLKEHKEEIERGEFLLADASGVTNISFTSEFIRRLPNDFPGSMVFVPACESNRLPNMAEAFLRKKAKVYFGYSTTVSGDFTALNAKQLACGMLAERLSAGDAFGFIEHLVDPYLVANGGAVFQMVGNGAAFSYPNDPPFKFEQSPLSSEVAQGETAEISLNMSTDLFNLCFSAEVTTTGNYGSILNDSSNPPSVIRENKTFRYKAFDTSEGEDTVFIKIWRKNFDPSYFPSPVATIWEGQAKVKVLRAIPLEFKVRTYMEGLWEQIEGTAAALVDLPEGQYCVKVWTASAPVKPGEHPGDEFVDTARPDILAPPREYRVSSSGDGCSEEWLDGKCILWEVDNLSSYRGWNPANCGPYSPTDCGTEALERYLRNRYQGWKVTYRTMPEEGCTD